MRTQRHGARRGPRTLRTGLGNLPYPPAAADAVCGLRGPPRLLRVVDIPVVLHYGHHERHLGGGDGVSFGLTCLRRGSAHSGETLPLVSIAGASATLVRFAGAENAS